MVFKKSLIISEDEIFNEIKNYISSVEGVREDFITKESNIIDLGVDSLDIVDLIMTIENKFNVSIDDNVVNKMSPVIGNIIRDLHEYIIYGKLLTNKERRSLKLHQINARQK